LDIGCFSFTPPRISVLVVMVVLLQPRSGDRGENSDVKHEHGAAKGDISMKNWYQ